MSRESLLRKRKPAAKEEETSDQEKNNKTKVRRSRRAKWVAVTKAQSKTIAAVPTSQSWIHHKLVVGWNRHMYIVNKSKQIIYVYDKIGTFMHQWCLDWPRHITSMYTTEIGAVTVGVEGGWSWMRPETEMKSGSATESKSCGPCPLDTHLMQHLHHVNELAAFPPGLLPLIMAYAVEEYIYATDTFTRCVAVYRSSGEYVRGWSTPCALWRARPTYSYGFSLSPIECVVDSQDHVIIADSRTKSLYAFQSNGTLLYLWKMDRCSVIYSFGMDARGYMYIDNGKELIYFDSNRMYQGKLKVPKYKLGREMLVGKDGRVYICSFFTVCLVSRDLSTIEKRVCFNKSGFKIDSFNVDYNGNLYLLNLHDGKVDMASPITGTS